MTKRAEYYRRYRATVKARYLRRTHQEGVREGIAMVCKFLDEIIGERPVTGKEASRLTDRALGANSLSRL